MAEIQGLNIDLGLKENGIQRSISEIQRSFRGLSGDLKLTNRAFDSAENSMSDYKNEINKLTVASNGLEKNLGDLRKELDREITTNGVASKKAIKLRNEFNKQSLSALTLQKRIDSLGDEYEQLAFKATVAGKIVNTGGKLKNSWDGMNDSINRIGDSFRNLGYVSNTVFQGMIVQNISSIVPVAGSAVSAIAGIGGALVAVSGGAIGLSGAFGIAFGGISAFVGQAKTALQMVEDGEMKATAELTRYNGALSSLKTQWKSLVQSNQGSIFNTMTNGINMAKTALTSLTPFITKTTNMIASMSNRMRNWVTSSQNATTAFKLINNIGPPIFQNILNSIFKVTDGLVHMANQFAPLFTWVGAGLESMANKFNKWANSTGTDNNVSQFIQYTKTNLPIVGQIFGNVFSGIVSLFQAFSGHSHTVLVGMQQVTNTFKNWANNLQGTEGFKNFIAYLNTNGPKVWQTLKNIGSIAVNVIQGLAPVGSVMMSVTRAVTGFIAKVTESKVVTTGLIGIGTVLAGMMMTFGPAILIVNSALKAYGFAMSGISAVTKICGAVQTAYRATVSGVQTATLLAMYATDKFKNSQLLAKVQMMAMKTQMVITKGATLAWTAVTKGATLATKGLGLAIRFMTGPVGIVITAITALVGVIVYLWKTNSTFRNSVIAIWNGIKNSAVTIFTALKSFFVNTWNGIKSVTLNVWRAIKNGVMTVIRLWVAQVRTNFNIMKLVVTTVFNFVKNWSIKIWRGIKNGIMAIIRGWVAVQRAQFNIMKKIVTTIFNFIKNWSIKIWRGFTNTIKNIVKAFVNVIRSRFTTLKNGIVKIITTLRNWLVKAWSFIRSKIVSIVSNLWSRVRGIFNSLSKGTRNIFNKVKSFLVNTWSSIRKRVVSIVSALWNGVRDKFNALKRGTSAIVSAVKSNLVGKFNSIKSRVTDIVSKMWSGVKNTFNNMKNGIKNFAGKIGDTITSMVNGIKKGLNSLIKAVNWVGGKLGVDAKIPQLHTGTDGASGSLTSNGAMNQNSLAVVNDRGRGNGSGPNGHQEVIQKANGQMYAPQGRNVTVPLEKGDKVINGRNTQRLQNAGVIPKFSRGTGDKTVKDMLSDARRAKRRKHKHTGVDAGEEMHGTMSNTAKEAFSAVSSAITGQGGKGKKKGVVEKITDGVKGAYNTTKNALGAAGNWAKEKAGDLLDYVGSPDKLLNKVMQEFGVSFKGIKGEIPNMLWGGMWKKLKEGVMSLFGGWLDDANEGDGDGKYIKYLDNITTPYSPNGPPKGYPFGWAHPGIDLPYHYEKVQTPLSGTAYTKDTGNVGFGHHVIVKSKSVDAIFGHMSKWAVKNGQHVNVGDTLGTSGNTGSSTGAHLHFELNKHGFGSMTGHSIDPVKWLKSHNGGGGKSGKWSGDIKKALKLAGLPTTSAYINAWKKQIQTESGGNPKALGGDDGLSDGRAKGLVQVKPGTFNAYKIAGHGNIWNGLDNLIAGMRYAKARYGAKGMLSAIGKGHGYATGGLINRNGLYNLAEGGFPEIVIPTDPSRSSDAMKLLSYAYSQVAGKGKGRDNKRPNQISNRYNGLGQSQDNSEIVNMQAQQLSAMQQQIDLLTQLVASTRNIEAQPKGFTEKQVSQAQGNRTVMQGYNLGL